MDNFFGNLLLLVATFGGTALVPVVGLASLPVEAGKPVLVITLPWADVVKIVEQSGGKFLSPPTSRITHLVTFEAEGFKDTLSKGGALLVLNGDASTILCRGARS